MKNRLPLRQSREHGVVLLFCLIVLVILLASGVAVMRSMNASMFSAGNLAFKRDLLNQGELAVAKAMTALKAGGALATATATATNVPSENYSAVQLETNERGIPNVLLTKGTPTGLDINGTTFAPTGADISGRVIAGTTSDVKVRYVIDRLCNATGTFAALGSTRCVYSPSAMQVTGGSSQRARDDLPPVSPTIYRVSVRVDGPRDTQVFMQTSFTKPEQ